MRRSLDSPKTLNESEEALGAQTLNRIPLGVTFAPKSSAQVFLDIFRCSMDQSFALVSKKRMIFLYETLLGVSIR
jgi:hypothetical protein